MSQVNDMAQAFKRLHQTPGKPLILANVYDILSARTIAELQSYPALATTSNAIARAAGTTDDDLTLEMNLASLKGIAAIAKEFGKPLTVDIQDGYGAQLEFAITELTGLGVAGINIEDCDKNQKLYDVDTAADRIRRVLDFARNLGVPDFVVNARCDVLVKGGELEEVLHRGKRYLEAGATTVFVWGASRGVTKEEVEEMVKAFDGRLNVLLKGGSDGLTYKQLAEIGVARISTGPRLQVAAVTALRATAESLLE